MTDKIYPVQIIDHKEKGIFLPETSPQTNKATVVFGSVAAEAKIFRLKRPAQRIIMTKPLQEALYIPDLPLKLHVLEHDGQFYLGPIVGIFTAGFKNFPKAPLGNRTFYFAKLLSIYEKAGVLPVVFGMQHINWQDGLVSGYVFDKQEWREVTVPLPHVIYNRIPNRRIEKLEIVQEVKKKLMTEYAIPWFNPGFFDKWELYKILYRDSRIGPHLPDTIVFRKKEDLERMLEQYGQVYVKWVDGSFGRKIFHIQKWKNDQLLCRFRDEQSQNRLIKYANIDSCMRHLFPNLNAKQYIIQQGISLRKTNGQAFDFRIHTNKRKDGTWSVTAIAVKVAGAESATTHLYSGGEIKTLQDLFPNEQEREAIERNLVAISLTFCEALEENINGFIGEVGIDMGMDTSGKIWIFEANAKPGRSIFSHPHFRSLERKNHFLLYSFAAALSEAMIKRPDSYIPFHRATEKNAKII